MGNAKSWWRTLATKLSSLTNRVSQVSRKTANWFQLDEAQLAEILDKVRAELPTTQAILIGKAQAGKSSIVRGLTGVSAEIVGQGFRPHTQHTKQYAYPADELPLLIFTDTVGLGDAQRNTEAIVAELTADLGETDYQGRILVLTVKITDFAIAALKTVVTALREKFPTLPCLLVVTSLHEVYPPEQGDHPPYPPELERVTEAFTEIKSSLAGLYEQAVLIDFTLEEDEFTPVFYGLETLTEALAALLPEAEAKAIKQLIEAETPINEEVGGLYREVARRYIMSFSVMAATVAAVPLPFATMPVLTALQVSMIGLLGRLYGQTLSRSQIGGVITAIAGGFVAQAVGRELIKFVPVLGSAVAASWAAGYTWSLGEGACVYFGDLMGGKTPDPEKIQIMMQKSFKEAQARFTRSQTPASQKPDS
ncbi:MAG: GTPase [Cyanobacteria bacterium P01_H01_bin.15]